MRHTRARTHDLEESKKGCPGVMQALCGFTTRSSYVPAPSESKAVMIGVCRN